MPNTREILDKLWRMGDNLRNSSDSIGALLRQGNLRAVVSGTVATEPKPANEWTQAQVEQFQVLRVLFFNGTTNDMNVDGSSTPELFKVTAVAGEIRWVTQIRFAHEGSRLNIANIEARRFGEAAASPGLTNGVKLSVTQSGSTTEIFVEPIQNIGNYQPPSDKITNNIDSVAAGEDFLQIEVDLPQPIGLHPDSADEIVITIQDDLTALDFYRAAVQGWREAV